MASLLQYQGPAWWPIVAYFLGLLMTVPAGCVLAYLILNRDLWDDTDRTLFGAALFTFPVGLIILLLAFASI